MMKRPQIHEETGDMSPFQSGEWIPPTADGSRGGEWRPKQLTDKERKDRRRRLVIDNAALCAHFFALKTELYLEHVCVGIMGATAYWVRYEWQSRGSAHAHYFLWFQDAPSNRHLDDWLKEEIESLIEGRDDTDGDGDDGGEAKLTEADLTHIEQRLNERAAADPAALEIARYWQGRVQQHNDAWDDGAEQPDMDTSKPHPASQTLGDVALAAGGDVGDLDSAAYADKTSLRDGDAPQWLVDDVCFCRNMMTRHTDHVPYCLRRNQDTGQVYCRFHYPLQKRDTETAHFYVERTGSKFRWKLYLGINDCIINSVNLWQMASHRANVDFRPLFDHHSAVEYATKYATKAEKGSKAQEAIFAHAMSRASKNYDDDDPATHVYASFLMQSIGARDWSSQEVGHVLFGHKTCIASHTFDYATLSSIRTLAPKLSLKKNFEPATAANKWDLYLRRIEFLAAKQKDPRQSTMHAHFDKTAKAMVEETTADDGDHITSCSFHEFYSNYTFARSLAAARNSQGLRKIVRRKSPTITVIKPRMPTFWCQGGHPKRPEYCRNRLLLHKVFLDHSHYIEYMTGFEWDFEAAYEDFASSDEAPQIVKDDFRVLEIEEDGEEVEQEKQPTPHGSYSLYESSIYVDQTRLQVKDYDWEGDTAANFTDAEVNDAATWMTKQLKESPITPCTSRIDTSRLNTGQRFVYDVVDEHASSGAPSRPMTPQCDRDRDRDRDDSHPVQMPHRNRSSSYSGLWNRRVWKDVPYPRIIAAAWRSGTCARPNWSRRRQHRRPDVSLNDSSSVGGRLAREYHAIQEANGEICRGHARSRLPDHRRNVHGWSACTWPNRPPLAPGHWHQFSVRWQVDNTCRRPRATSASEG